CDPLVLGVQCADIQDFRALCFMRMFSAGIDTKILHLPPTQRTARDHPFDGLLDHALRKAALENLARRTLLDAARMPCMPIIFLVGVLLSAQRDLVGIDDDDVVSVIDMRGESRLVLAAKAGCDQGGKTSD